MWWSSDGHTWGMRPEVPVLMEQLPEYRRANASSVIIIVFNLQGLCDGDPF